MGPVLGHQAGVVTGTLFLLVGGLMLFVDDNEAQVLKRTEDGGTDTD